MQHDLAHCSLLVLSSHQSPHAHEYLFMERITLLAPMCSHAGSALMIVREGQPANLYTRSRLMRCVSCKYQWARLALTSRLPFFADIPAPLAVTIALENVCCDKCRGSGTLLTGHFVRQRYEMVGHTLIMSGFCPMSDRYIWLWVGNSLLNCWEAVWRTTSSPYLLVPTCNTRCEVYTYRCQ